MNDFANLQRVVAKALTLLSAIHVPILFVLGLVLGFNPFLVGLLAAVAALIPCIMNAIGRSPRAVGVSLAIALVCQTTLLVDLLAGKPWQLEMHFYYFAILAMLAGFCDSLVLLSAAALIALDHIVLNELIPDALYPGGGSLARVGIHAIMVVIETTVLIFIGSTIKKSFLAASEAKQMAQEAAKRLSAVGAERNEQLASTIKRADRLEHSLAEFRVEIAASLERLFGASSELNATADEFSKSVHQTTSQTVAVYSAAEAANQRVAQIAAAGREYSEMMSKIGEHALLSARTGSEAVAQAEATKAATDELLALSGQIESAAKLIAGIARQTNLIALNATIEAARSGEHGRGFSAVASEIKALALRTAEATASISETVAWIQGSMKRSASALSSVAVAIHGLNGAAVGIANSVEERVHAAARMAANVDAAASEVQKVTIAIEAIETVAEISGHRAGSLHAAAGEVANQAELIRKHVESFATDFANAHKGLLERVVIAA